MTTSPFREK